MKFSDFLDNKIIVVKEAYILYFLRNYKIDQLALFLNFDAEEFGSFIKIADVKSSTFLNIPKPKITQDSYGNILKCTIE